VVQMDSMNAVIDEIMNTYPYLAQELANTVDQDGRKAINIASYWNQSTILEYLYFLKRYDISDISSPQHKSATSVIYIGAS
jgi:hypothetical protein